MNNYFGFIDESGNSSQEKFFGLGLLLIDDEIGNFYDAIKPYYDKARDISKIVKQERITELTKQGEFGQIAEIARSSRRFELKFKYINNVNNLIYKELTNGYFRFPKVRFCALVIDRQDIAANTMLEPWDTYIHRAAMLLANNIKNINPCEVCILADDLTKPKDIKKTFERSLKDAINARLVRAGIRGNIFGVTRLESHSSLLLQVVDILLGAVMYDFKKPLGLISDKLAQRQEVVVENIRQALGTRTLAANTTYHKPNYFSVWKLTKQA